MRSFALTTTVVALTTLIPFVFAQDGSISGPGTSPQAANYTCDPNQCKLPNCRCASTSIPGDIPHDETPMFLVFTACVLPIQPLSRIVPLDLTGGFLGGTKII